MLSTLHTSMLLAINHIFHIDLDNLFYKMNMSILKLSFIIDDFNECQIIFIHNQKIYHKSPL